MKHIQIKRLLLWGLLIGQVMIGLAILFVWLFSGVPWQIKPTKKVAVNPAISQTAQAFAMQFAREYYQWSPEGEQDRKERLRPYLAKGIDEQAGIQFSSVQMKARLEMVNVWKIADQGNNQSAITVVAQVMLMREVDGEQQVKVVKRWLSIPVQAMGQDRFVVRSVPYRIPPPTMTKWRLTSKKIQGQAVDEAQSQQIQRTMHHFFGIYGSGDEEQMRYLMRSNTLIWGYRGAMKLLGVTGIEVVRNGSDYKASGQVHFQEADTQVEVAYPFTARLRQTEERWYVHHLTF